MVSVLSILIWIVVIVGIVKGFSGNDSKKTQPTQNSTQKTVQQFKSGAQKIISEISAYADAAEQGTSTGNKTSYNQTQRSYNAQQNAYAQPTNIVDRAKQNTNKYAEDTTLEQLEKEHKHSERESKAEAAYVAKEREEHRKLHTEPIPPVEEESLLGSVQDLMIKGYDGNLSFERDFVGEAMDLLNSFTVQ